MADAESRRRARVLVHLFGPALLAGGIGLATTLIVWGAMGSPPARYNTYRISPEPPAKPTATAKPAAETAKPAAPDATRDAELVRLLGYQVDDYKSHLVKFEANVSLHALLVITTVLLIIRRGDALNLFGNSIPLSWLHFFVPIALLALWLSFGFTLHGLIWSRIRGVEIILARPDYQPQYKALFQDAGLIDGWFLTFVDPHAKRFSGIDPIFSVTTAGFLVFVLGTLMSAAHACMLAITSIGCRRYLRTDAVTWLKCYYFLPLLLLVCLLVSHLQFAYGGPNPNWIQLYVALVTPLLTMLLLWLSVRVDGAAVPDSVQCLRRQCRQFLPQAVRPGELDLWRKRSRNLARPKLVCLVGDSLSTSFHVGRRAGMLVRLWRRWRHNWLLDLPRQAGVGPTVLARLSELVPVIGCTHATVSAHVDEGKPRTLTEKILNRWHFSQQIDEILAGEFPDLLLLWIGHNNLDWMNAPDSPGPEKFQAMADHFTACYEVQLRRLLNAALACDRPIAVIVFGLINFAGFFRAREEAERRKAQQRSLFPALEKSYLYFLSMRPAFRAGMVQLALLYNQGLERLCRELGAQLTGTNTRLVYSDAMAAAEIEEPDFLSPVDAWHPSPHGHSVLAERASVVVLEQVEFLRWTEEAGDPTPSLGS